MQESNKVEVTEEVSTRIDNVVSMQMDSTQVKKLIWAGLGSTIGVMIGFVITLMIFAAIIAHYEVDREIEENREFRDLLIAIAPNITAEQLQQVVKFSERDPVRGVEGFSNYDETKNDWNNRRASTFFAHVSYTYELASTVGYGSFTAKTIGGRVWTIICIIITVPIAIAAYTLFVDQIFNLVAHVVLRSDAKYSAVIARYQHARDGDNNKKLDAKELFLCFQDLGLNVTPKECKLILHQFDKDHDDLLDETEFRELCINLRLKAGLLARTYFQIEFSLIAFLVYVLIFTVITYLATDIDFFESFYFVVVTISTVGLGDVTPPQDVRGIFSVLSFIGIGIFALLFKAIVEKIYDRADLKKRYMHRALEPLIENRKIRGVKIDKKMVPGEEGSATMIDQIHPVESDKAIRVPSVKEERKEKAEIAEKIEYIDNEKTEESEFGSI